MCDHCDKIFCEGCINRLKKNNANVSFGDFNNDASLLSVKCPMCKKNFDGKKVPR